MNEIKNSRHSLAMQQRFSSPVSVQSLFPLRKLRNIVTSEMLHHRVICTVILDYSKAHWLLLSCWSFD